MSNAITDDQPPMERFHRFFYERQAIWHRRHALGLPAPWTDDPHLRRFRFCNVIRDLDEGTRVLLDDVLTREDLTVAEKVHGTVFYRLVNNRRTWRELTGIVTSPAEMVTALANLEGRKGVWSSAWICSGISRLAPLAVRADYGEVIAAVAAGCHFSEVKSRLSPLPTMSGLLGHQVSLDLTTLWPRREADVAYAYAPSSGAHRRGTTAPRFAGSASAASLLGDGPPARVIQTLRDRFDERLAYHNLNWLTVTPPGFETVYLQDIEHGLCEWLKHERVRTGLTRNPSRPYPRGEGR